MMDRLPFESIWVLDFECHQIEGGLPDPLCVVARELRSGAECARWLDPATLGRCRTIPVPGRSSWRMARMPNGSAMSCLIGRCRTLCSIRTPRFRAARNGLEDGKANLLVAASRYGIPTISTAAKDAGRAIAMLSGHTPSSTKPS
jgi:hypothetical protein